MIFLIHFLIKDMGIASYESQRVRSWVLQEKNLIGTFKMEAADDPPYHLFPFVNGIS